MEIPSYQHSEDNSESSGIASDCKSKNEPFSESRTEIPSSQQPEENLEFCGDGITSEFESKNESTTTEIPTSQQLAAENFKSCIASEFESKNEPSAESTAEIPSAQQPVENPESCDGVMLEFESMDDSEHAENNTTELHTWNSSISASQVLDRVIGWPVGWKN